MYLVSFGFAKAPISSADGKVPILAGAALAMLLFVGFLIGKEGVAVAAFAVPVLEM